MDKQTNLQLIQALSEANGAPGFEDDVAALLASTCQPYGEATTDAMRNLFVQRSGNTGNRPVVMLDAHTDEVAFMVQAIRPNGTLSFIPLGGWTPSSVPAHKVRVRTASGTYIPGVIASKPPHFTSEADRRAMPDLSQMVIDVGATSLQDAVENFGVAIGEPVVPDAAFTHLAPHDVMMGKAFDCRLGCAALALTLRQLAGTQLPADIVATFTTQEEVGTRGSIVATNAVRPSAAIVFEGTPADDTTADGYAVQTALKKGPMLRYIDSRTITNPRFQRFALETGRAAGIPVQAAVRTSGGTNAAAIHLSGSGVPVIVIGVPVRYLHTHYGIAAYTDVENAVKLACAILQKLDADTIASF